MTTLKLALITLATGMALQSAQTHAAVVAHSVRGNAVNYCQAFTPGPANTIRNRVVGAENIGPPIAVACDFQSMDNGGVSSEWPNRLTVYFANNNPSTTITVTCTMLTSYQGSPSAYAVTKTTVAIPAGGTSQRILYWTVADNPNAAATDLGSAFIGINCTLPTGAVINQAYLIWDQDNGI